MIFARRVFFFAGILGLVVLAPMYFLEGRIARDFPPAISHPEHFYGFIGVALAWQIVFIVISRDPIRYRLMMLPSILEKLAFGVAVWLLFLQGRVPTALLAPASIDLLFAVLFGAAYWRLRAGGGS